MQVFPPETIANHLKAARGSLDVHELEIALSGLSSETRLKVIEELQAASRDTAVEYHKMPLTENADLWHELQCLNAMIYSAMGAENEWQETILGDNPPDERPG